MKRITKYKVDKGIIFCIISFFLISIFSIKSAQNLLPSYMNNLMIKQIIWYILGFLIAFLIMRLGNEFIYKHTWFLYSGGVILLIALLIFADPVNNAKCWFSIPGIGAFQPSEFMKIILIITIGSLLHKFNEAFPSPTIKDEFILLLKVGMVVLVPSILTFMQPDTGVVFSSHVAT